MLNIIKIKFLVFNFEIFYYIGIKSLVNALSRYLDYVIEDKN